MKKRNLIIAGVLALSAVAAGCGNKDEAENTGVDAQVTVAPTPTAAADSGLVNMQESSDNDTAGIKNVIGEKSNTASQLIIVNKMGSEIADIYIRPKAGEDDSDEWGDELVQGAFTLKNGDKALYYYDKNSGGTTASAYDMRISFTDEEKSECFFRNLSLTTMSQISLCMDGTGEDGIPYARYLSGTNKKESSTLNEVKRRIGLSDSDEEDAEENTEDETDTPTEDENNSNTETPAPTQAPANPTEVPAEDPTEDPGEDEPDPGASAAEQYIGQSLDTLIGACGEPGGSDYENDPGTGETGYHYYPTFTVSTTVDENGNEIVAGIW